MTRARSFYIKSFETNAVKLDSYIKIKFMYFKSMMQKLLNELAPEFVMASMLEIRGTRVTSDVRFLS